MGKSKALTVADTRSVVRLVGECRELGDDPVIWRQRLFAGLNRLVGADLVIGGEMAGCLNGPLTSPGTTAWGFEQGYDTAGLRIMMEWFQQDPFFSVSFRQFIGALRQQKQPAATIPRQQVLNDRQWQFTPDCQILGRTLDIDSYQHSFHSLGHGTDEFSGMLIMREKGRPLFDDREVALVDLLHSEIARLIGGPLARWNEPSPSQLAPRVRQVLKCVLEGDADKQIAVRLNLSQHTVNQYMKVIYRHYQVSSRGELLARWLRRGWSSQGHWEQPELPPTFDLGGG